MLVWKIEQLGPMLVSNRKEHQISEVFNWNACNQYLLTELYLIILKPYKDRAL